jgi:catechol 2,3-dioxygenase-like lactoylglutathione lyase family enzyme
MIKTVWSVTFCVSDMKKATRFYEKTLGLEKKYEFSSYAGFECGGVEIGLIPKKKEQGSHDSAPTVGFLVYDVEKTCAELKAKGVKFIKELHEEAWGGRQASFTDPDENILEVTQMNWKKYFEVSAKGA